MKELADIVAAWETLCREGREAVLATVVGVSGSTYRRPGARMLLTPEGRLAGSISGGCLEGDLLQKAWWHTRGGPVVITYDSMDEEDDVVWGFGLGCNGVVQVLLERVSPDSPGPLEFLRTCLRARRPGVIATVIRAADASMIGKRLLLPEGDEIESSLGEAALDPRVRDGARQALANGRSRTQTFAGPGGEVDMFLEVVQPPLPLVVFGAGHDVTPLVRLAKEVGWHVTVVDTRAARAKPERFPQADVILACSPEEARTQAALTARTAAVVMTHNYPDDRQALQMLLLSPVRYIGQLGPRARTERLLAEIAADGFEVTPSHRNRLHGPVGLDIGADNPEEIALAIVAEIQAVQAGRSARPLTERLPCPPSV